MELKIGKARFPVPSFRLAATAPKAQQKRQPSQKKKKASAFAKEKKELLQSIRKNSLNADTRLVGKAFSFIAGIPGIPKARGERLLVEKAFSFSEEKHGSQKRLSGDPYFSHAFQTALILSEYGLDSSTISAALLHDVIEDTDVKDAEIREKFGDDVLKLVSGVTKLRHSEGKEAEAEEKEYLKSVLRASSEDVRVLLIKLADKVHNLRTIEFMPPKRRKEICRNALEVYAPLAERFGLNRMREEIEDRGFQALYPGEFEEMAKAVEERRNQQELDVDEVAKALSAIKISGRKRFFQKYSFRKIKRNLYSYYRKTQKKHRTLDELYDFVSLVILCGTVGECYEALKTVHSTFYPIPGKLKDRIAAPHYMTYQSISTSVIGPKGNPVKIFIRTKEMDLLAENGITVWLKEKSKAKLDEKELESLGEI
ncbi:MAG: HD domain-containing protein, partial [Candidatus Diapherotrites archaeon]